MPHGFNVFKTIQIVDSKICITMHIQYVITVIDHVLDIPGLL